MRMFVKSEDERRRRERKVESLNIGDARRATKVSACLDFPGPFDIRSCFPSPHFLSFVQHPTICYRSLHVPPVRRSLMRITYLIGLTVHIHQRNHIFDFRFQFLEIRFGVQSIYVPELIPFPSFFRVLIPAYSPALVGNGHHRQPSLLCRRNPM